jgi:hypothetical protein
MWKISFLLENEYRSLSMTNLLFMVINNEKTKILKIFDRFNISKYVFPYFFTTYSKNSNSYFLYQFRASI